eukprot:CAMPEP_0194550932 /NCGR_PEP_ID=MMETSP0253-20130528/95964_1 /TAXON_ID=2966 /ORGANISM="Noctiluca scintillans" /LENGTH=256 /DNA_ID=CAMNT_0039398383 /DNA_START=194 /DNA_END=966 /DNA_ORIENTATION=-
MSSIPDGADVGADTFVRRTDNACSAAEAVPSHTRYNFSKSSLLAHGRTPESHGAGDPDDDNGTAAGGVVGADVVRGGAACGADGDLALAMPVMMMALALAPAPSIVGDLVREKVLALAPAPSTVGDLVREKVLAQVLHLVPVMKMLALARAPAPSIVGDLVREKVLLQQVAHEVLVTELLVQAQALTPVDSLVRVQVRSHFHLFLFLLAPMLVSVEVHGAHGLARTEKLQTSARLKYVQCQQQMKNRNHTSDKALH